MIRNNKLILLSFIAFLCISFTTLNSPKDFLGVGKKINFDKKEYSLVWSSNPSDNYYKQEYLPEGATLKEYNDMIIIESIIGDLTVEDAAKFKISELELLKKTNPVVNYNIYDNGNEKIIDFVISDGAYIFEWNLYRYKNEKSKNKALVLYAYTYRDSIVDNEVLKPFFGRIADNRNDIIKQLGELKLPKVKIK
ncbi:hypothetical protein ERX46_14880 [Brumimicrobium glaciale]|uniref:Uncharacterized protein n=1 Tax=Brumimicrobium glaciale TaxID=200475 RepID=A0A4Q4KH36_9FLAO|nr:hypothetical protein [Brumimicrobium glaciale]RYM32553.1 hypothetical protein ERX46_14880 [Brumimicrobium glaciale]